VIHIHGVLERARTSVNMLRIKYDATNKQIEELQRGGHDTSKQQQEKENQDRMIERLMWRIYLNEKKLAKLTNQPYEFNCEGPSCGGGGKKPKSL
jgi:redox-regulated HSP33 family molecular chaperone